MQVLALDIGDVRVGIAVGRTDGCIAMPLCVLPLNEVLSQSKNFRYLLADHEPDLLLCGLPLSLSGEQSAQTQHVRDLATQISQSNGLPLEFVDERLSSSEAKRILRMNGHSEKSMRGRVDAVAASLFLQTWLDSQSASTADEPKTTEV